MGSFCLMSSSSSSSIISHPTSQSLLIPHNQNPLSQKACTNHVHLHSKNTTSTTTRASLSSSTNELVQKDFHQRRALKALKICVSSVDLEAFPTAVDAGASMVEIGNYDSYEIGTIFSPETILKLTRETRRSLPSVVLSVTVPHTLSLPDQLEELLEQEGVDIIQTEGGKCSSPSKPGVLGLIEKACPTFAAAYSISRAVKIPVMCSSGLSAVTAPMALTAGHLEWVWVQQ